MTVITWLIFLVILTLPGAANAVTRYVHPGCTGNTYNPGGVGACTGGSSLVYSTINTALNASTAGDIIDIRGGLYNERLDVSAATTGTRLQGTNYSNGLKIQGHSGETVELRPNGNPIIDARFTSYLTVSNIILDGRNANNSAIPPANPGPCTDHAYSCDHNFYAEGFVRFDGIETRNCGMTTLRGCAGGKPGNDVEFINGSSHDNGTTAPGSTFTGAQAPYGFYWAGANGIIRNNKIYNNGAFGIHAYSASLGINNNTIEQNEFYNNGVNYWFSPGSRRDSSAILLTSGSGGVIQNNVIRSTNNGQSNNNGIFVGLGHTGATVQFNTITNMLGPGIQIGDDATKITVINNIVSNNGTNIQRDAPSTGSSFSRNLCSTFGGITNCDLTEAPSATFQNPAGATAADFKLQANSVARNAASGCPPPTTDFALTPRNAPCDIGAYAFSVPIVTSPVLVAQYAFDENSGTTLNDSSGNNNHGSFSTGVSWSTSGKYIALSFDGTGGVTIPNSLTLQLADGFTLEAWVNPSSVLNDAVIVSKNASNYSLFASIDGYCPANNSPMGYFSGIDGGHWVCSSPLSTGQWTHVAVSYSRAAAELLFYINAKLQTKLSSTTQIASSTGTVQIGTSQFGENYIGLIREIRIYSGAIPATAGTQPDMDSCITAPSIYKDMVCPISKVLAPTSASGFRIGAAGKLVIGVGGNARLGQ